jgi:hypothetical protein
MSERQIGVAIVAMGVLVFAYIVWLVVKAYLG